MADEQVNKAIDAVAISPADRAVASGVFVASNGLRLRLRRVSQMILTDAARRLKAPGVPTTFIEEKGREAENPADPAYIEAMRNYRYDMGMLAVSTYFILGTKVDGALPEGISPIGDDDWAETLKAIDPGADIPDSGPRRYLAWLKYHALPDTDQTVLLQACIRFSGGTLEVDVEQAQSTFRNIALRDTVGRVLSADENRVGDQPGELARNGAGVRGEGSSGLRAVSVGEVDTPPEF